MARLPVLVARRILRFFGLAFSCLAGGSLHPGSRPAPPAKVVSIRIPRFPQTPSNSTRRALHVRAHRMICHLHAAPTELCGNRRPFAINMSRLRRCRQGVASKGSDCSKVPCCAIPWSVSVYMPLLRSFAVIAGGLLHTCRAYGAAGMRCSALPTLRGMARYRAYETVWVQRAHHRFA